MKGYFKLIIDYAAYMVLNFFQCYRINKIYPVSHSLFKLALGVRQVCDKLKLAAFPFSIDSFLGKLGKNSPSFFARD